MECVEAALKSSLRKDMALKLTPQALLEDLSAFNVQNITSCEDFSVDDLLDFSHEEGILPQQQQQQQQEPEQQQNHTPVSVSPQHNNTQNQSHEACYPLLNDHFGSLLPTTELSVPAEDAADLEWLSYFVEDSFSEKFPTGTITENLAAKAPEPETLFSFSTTPCFKTPVPAKARSKRTRTGVRVWPLRSPSFADSSSTPSSSSSSSSSSSHFEQCCSETNPPEKKAKKRTSPEGEGRGGGSASQPRRCSHCGVQKTPQWRTGPHGAKTLCNACGVRFKSGRLLPEYRPACSPTFSSELHSNHHRKVLEMRRKKEVVGGPVTGSAPPPVVPGF